MLFHMPRLVFHGSMSVFMVCGGFSWFFSVPDYFYMVPGRFYDHLWFQVVFFHGSRTQVGFYGYSWFQVVFLCFQVGVYG